MTDKELLEILMNLNTWTQTELAKQIGFSQANVSNVITDKQRLSNTSRKVAELLLEQSQE